MQLPELRMSFADRARLSVEITQSLRCGRAFLSETSTLPVLSDCVLVLVHPEHGGELRLPAQIVMANEHGTGLSLTTLNAQHLLELDSFVDSAPPLAAAEGDVTAAACCSSPPGAGISSPPTAASAAGTARISSPPTAAFTASSAARNSSPPSAAGAPAAARISSPPTALSSAARNSSPPSAAAPGAAARINSPPSAAAAPGAAARISAPPAAGAATAARISSPPSAAAAFGASARISVPPPAGGGCAEAANDVALPLSAAEGGASPDAVEGHEGALLGDAAEALEFSRADEEELEYAEPGQASVTGTELQSESRQERLRNLSPNEQLKVARRGELADRLAVERMYGKQVWDALLQNPRLTIPEVAKIARKGTVPKPLLDVILDNNAWIKADAVRRALLTNPKIGVDAVTKLLRITPKHELKLIEKGTTYGAVVREAARRLLKQQG